VISSKADKIYSNLLHVLYQIQGRDSVVGIATRYGTDGPRVESLWGRDFQYPSRPRPA
jgi:hypothetical protein